MIQLLLPAALAALAQDGARPRVLLESLEGTVVEHPADAGPLRDLRAAGAAFARYLGTGEPQPPPGDLAGRVVAYLHSGDRVWGRVAGGDDERIELALHGGARLSLAIEELGSLLFPRRLPTDGSADPRPADEGDRLYLARGRGLDKLDGLLAAFAADGVVFEGRFGQRTHPWSEVAALYVEDLREAGGPEPAVPVVVDLPDGGRLSGGLVEMGSAGVRLSLAGTELRLPPEVVREVALDDGSFVFLSQLPIDDPGPVTLFGGEDDLGMVYPPRVDRNCLDGPLTSGGRSWSRGIGVHSPSRLTWRLEPGWRELRALAAIDDSVLRNEVRGSVRFRILVDGELRWESPVLHGGDPPVAAPSVSLEGARELVLEVDPATDFVVSDRANWLRPILVRR